MGNVKSFLSLLLFAASLFVPLSVVEAGENVRSKVTAVTVYSDRVLITRTADTRVAAGTNTVNFGGLPVSLVDQSVRVSGDADASMKILDVQIKTEYVDTIADTRVGSLDQKLNSLKSKEQTILKRLEVMETEMAFIDSIRVYYARTAANSNVGNASSDWQKALSFVEKNMDSINARTLTATAELQDTREKIKMVQDEINRTLSYPRKMEKEVVVTLSSEQAGDCTLRLLYLLKSARWSPTYEVRVNSETQKMELVYSGVVSQATGEDWKGVAMTLSTAQPSAGGAPPVLHPWEVGFYGSVHPPSLLMKSDETEREFPGSASISVLPIAAGQAGYTVTGSVLDHESGDPLPGASVSLDGTSYGAATDMYGNFTILNVPAGSYPLRVSYIGYRRFTTPTITVSPSSIVQVIVELSATVSGAAEVLVKGQAARVSTALAAVALPEARLSESVTASTFAIAAPADIPSDNSPHKVTITTASLPVELSYSCVPKLSPGAFLTANVKNSTSFPLLSGSMNVFLDNSFVATTSLKNVFPDHGFSAYMGTDAAVKVERKLVKQFTETTGLLSKKTKTTYDFLISLENGKKVPIDIDVKDQVPVSRNEKIVVEVLSPDPSEVKPDEQGILDWKLNLKPGEKKELRLKFSIEYPADLSVSGIQ